MTLQEFTDSLMPESESNFKDVQISKGLFARIYGDDSVYLEDSEFYFALTKEEVEKLCQEMNSFKK